jgi:hypothetical protein
MAGQVQDQGSKIEGGAAQTCKKAGGFCSLRKARLMGAPQWNFKIKY